MFEHIGIEEIDQECKKVLSSFINDLNRENTGPSDKLNLFFRIEYGRLSIMRQVNDENMTFYRLKQETKLQFDKNDNLYLFLGWGEGSSKDKGR